MFAFKRPKVINQLTQLINKDINGTKVRDVLKNNDLSPSIRNEVPELLDFFCPPLPPQQNTERPESSRENYKLQEERQTELSLLAFTSKLNRDGEEYADDQVYFRFNRNASNIISSPSKKFHDRLIYYYSDGNGKCTPSPFLEQLIKFARSMKGKISVHHQTVFYGHFHRIFEALVRSSKGSFFDTIYKLAPDLNPFYTVILNRIDLTSIRQLYVTCTSEFPQQFAGSDCKNQDPSAVFIKLSNFGAEESHRIHGQKGKTLRKVHIRECIFNEFKGEKSKNKDFCIEQLDDVGYKKKIKYLTQQEAAKKTNAKREAAVVQSSSGKTKLKKSRYYHFQMVIASLITIRDILNDSTEIVRYFRNNEVIENLLKIGKNAPESSFIVSLSYNLILRIATYEKKSLSDFDRVLNQNEFLPDLSKLPNLKKRIESIQSDQETECSGEHLIYQMPLYFLKLSEDFHDLFFTEKKYSMKFDEQFVYTIKHVLSKQQQIDYFSKDDNKFLKKLCKALPEPPKLDLKNFSNADSSVDPELPSIQVQDNIVDNDFRPQSHEPLQSFLWDLAKYIDDEKRFKESEIPFKKNDEWIELHDKVKNYYDRVYAYVDEPVDEEEEDMLD